MKKYSVLITLVLSMFAVSCTGSSADAPDTTSAAGATGADGDFCQSARRTVSAMMMLGMLFDPEVPDKDSVEYAFRSIASFAENMLEVAPDEMRDQAQTVFDNATEQVKLLKGVDFDLNRILEDPDFQEVDEDPATDEALQAIQDHCGISLQP